MSADILRRAASLMRERADEAAGLLVAAGINWYDPTEVEGALETSKLATPAQAKPDSEHIASWHPAVALAVADWLDSEDTHQFGPTEHAINVARAYLGETE